MLRTNFFMWIRSFRTRTEAFCCANFLIFCLVFLCQIHLIIKFWYNFFNWKLIIDLTLPKRVFLLTSFSFLLWFFLAFFVPRMPFPYHKNATKIGIFYNRYLIYNPGLLTESVGLFTSSIQIHKSNLQIINIFKKFSKYFMTF